VVFRPSVIPSGGRALEPAEHALLEQDMEAIVLGSHLFKSLDEAGRKDALQSAFVMRFSANDVILREGDPGDTMFLVMEGSVRVETRTPSGSIQLAELGRGACVGEVSVLTGGPRTATVTAITDVSVATFARHRIQRIVDANPRVRALLEQLVEGRAKDTVGKLIGS
jgi:CRP/FNR family cyclic AMP-dependent transcriptional regulator